ncbi:MAG: MarR family transcriptional regulator [Anaerolineae bacterium]|nr:MarR family transcriptional regulator [Anaerolineae bacterium]
MMSAIPEEIARLKEHLDKVYLGDEPQRMIVDHDLFFRVGVIILSQYKEPVSMGELSKALDVPLSTATRIVDGLVDNGLAERTADPEDRRVVRVSLTQRGQDLHQIMNAFIQQRLEGILSRFTPEEREQLVRLLRKVADAFDEVV